MIKYHIEKYFGRVNMRFLKENSYNIVKLYINQLGISIFSLLLYSSVATMKNEKLSLELTVGISVFAILFYFALIYTAAWDIGASDIIKIESGRMKSQKYKGALLAFFANFANLVLAGICVVAMLVYMNGNEGAIGFSQVSNLILRLTDAMYIGSLQGIFSAFSEDANMYNLLQSYGFLATPLLSVIVTHLGYILGMKNFKIFPSSKKAKK